MSNPAPGWYPDSTGAQRWWDGTQWAATAQAPYSAAAGFDRAPEGTSPNTVHVWLIVAIFGIQSIAGLVWLATWDLSGYMDSMMSLSTSPSSTADVFAMYGFIFTPGYFAVLALSFFGYVGTAVLAYLDAKELIRRGVQRPFPWALSFIPSYGSLVYMIGRTVVVRRRTGAGFAPLGVYIAVFVLMMILSIVVSIAMMSNMMNSLSGLYSTYP